MFIFGNEVTGGVLGQNPIIDPKTTYEHNLDMQFDFRQINASILEQWFGISTSDTANALLGQFQTLPIIGKQEPVVSGLNTKNAQTTTNIYPNPLNGSTKIEFEADGNPIEIRLFDM
jgi:hypothetical protein